jgi:LysR family transcriptional regulator, cys regulon transcriptional activator
MLPNARLLSALTAAQLLSNNDWACPSSEWIYGRFVTAIRPLECAFPASIAAWHFTAEFTMKLQQLRYLAAIVNNGLNITAAADKLRTSQPAVSKQVKLLEDELGFDIFLRNGRTLTEITVPGQQVVAHALRILREAQCIKNIGRNLDGEERGTLSIGTTHTQARYVLPSVIERFRQKYPKMQLHLHQGTSEQIAEMAKMQRLDFAIATGSKELFPNLVLLPCYQWYRRIIVPKDHPLAHNTKPALAQLASFPIVTYVFSFSGPSSLNEQFHQAGLNPNVALTARDADVIKTYVRLKLGVGIVAGMAVNPQDDPDLVSIDASHLFPVHTTWIGFQRGTLLWPHMYDFMQLLAPHLNRRLVERAAGTDDGAAIEALFSHLRLPVRSGEDSSASVSAPA